MRDILFRGISKCNNKWVYGFYSMQNLNHGFVPVIIQFDGGSTVPDAVEPETVGQFTGYTIDNQKLFEGDILRFGDFNYQPEPYIEIAAVEWDDKRAAFTVYDDTLDIIFTYHNFEIIGNIYDNKDLLNE